MHYILLSPRTGRYFVTSPGMAHGIYDTCPVHEMTTDYRGALAQVKQLNQVTEDERKARRGRKRFSMRG